MNALAMPEVDVDRSVWCPRSPEPAGIIVPKDAIAKTALKR